MVSVPDDAKVEANTPHSGDFTLEWCYYSIY